MRRIALILTAAAYAAGLVYVTLVASPQPGPAPNLTPLKTIASCCAIGGATMLVNVVGNLALLAPLGMLLPMARPGRVGPRAALLAGLALSVAIESAQFACGHRMADVDDVLLNTAGAPLGYAAWKSAVSAARPAGSGPRAAVAPPAPWGRDARRSGARA